MNDKPPSTNGSGKTGVFKRVIRAIKGEPLSRDDIQDLLQEDQSVFEPEEKEMLSGVLEVAETQVRDVMIPRSQMVVIEREHTLDEMMSVILSTGHSRFPVIGEDRDEVLGIDDYLRPVSVIPESKRLNALLKEFRDSHSHMAIVVDEYGGVSGLLTIEDVLEEIVGEIDDEHDPEEAEFIQPDTDIDGRPCFAVRALTRIEDFNEYFGCDITEEEDFDTVGGLVMHELGRLPRLGEKLQYDRFEFCVIRADRRRIDSLQVVRLVQDPEPFAG
jgi:magnesium and cobalt transporter